LGAKLGKLFGERLVFQVTAAVHGVSMVMMAVALAASLSVRLYDRLSPRKLGVICFVLISIGSAFVGFSISNDLSQPGATPLVLSRINDHLT
jgi:hypothetical protein